MVGSMVYDCIFVSTFVPVRLDGKLTPKVTSPVGSEPLTNLGTGGLS